MKLIEPVIYGRYVPLPKEMERGIPGLMVTVVYLGIDSSKNLYSININQLKPTEDSVEIVRNLSIEHKACLFTLADIYEEIVRRSFKDLSTEHKVNNHDINIEVIGQRMQILKNFYDLENTTTELWSIMLNNYSLDPKTKGTKFKVDNLPFKYGWIHGKYVIEIIGSKLVKRERFSGVNIYTLGITNNNYTRVAKGRLRINIKGITDLKWAMGEIMSVVGSDIRNMPKYVNETDYKRSYAEYRFKIGE